MRAADRRWGRRQGDNLLGEEEVALRNQGNRGFAPDWSRIGHVIPLFLGREGA